MASRSRKDIEDSCATSGVEIGQVLGGRALGRALHDILSHHQAQLEVLLDIRAALDELAHPMMKLVVPPSDADTNEWLKARMNEWWRASTSSVAVDATETAYRVSDFGTCVLCARPCAAQHIRTGEILHPACAPTADDLKALPGTRWPAGPIDWTALRDLRIAAIPEVERCGHLWGPMGIRCVGRVTLYKGPSVSERVPVVCHDRDCPFTGKSMCSWHDCIPF